ncbi:DNA primase small subunit domain-containing protein [Candidatus Borrarchaeum sp.]|uniref:DNA primase small subunit domain-containing protein n=1 Tax=Candidatus Borrarchaeum sp. TaxID=2846742 RepID=UPI00257A629D|nr:DNA primase small subunit domain-containing protein [Candidatus Borrarchaeum sp.]
MNQFWRFYEYAALAAVAQSVGPIFTNVRFGDSTSPEYDGLSLDGQTVVEVKSYPLSRDDCKKLVEKTNKHFEKLIIIAPGFKNKYLEKGQDIWIEYMTFTTENFPSRLQQFYQEWEPQLPKYFETRLGWHHFSYVMSSGRFRNQIDKRISNTEKLKREVTKRVVFPLRIFVSISKWRDPKQLFFRKNSNTLLDSILAFDIDCSDLHVPCLLTQSGICEIGLDHVKHETMKLFDFCEDKLSLTDFMIYFSGRKGFHVYFCDYNSSKSFKKELEFRKDLVEKLKENNIRADSSITEHPKAMVGLPSSLHGYTMREICLVGRSRKRITSFRPPKPFNRR